MWRDARAGNRAAWQIVEVTVGCSAAESARFRRGEDRILADLRTARCASPASPIWPLPGRCCPVTPRRWSWFTPVRSIPVAGWPRPHFADVVSRCVRGGALVALVGPAADAELLNDIWRQADQQLSWGAADVVVVLAGIDAPTMCGLLALGGVVVGGDSQVRASAWSGYTDRRRREALPRRGDGRSQRAARAITA